MTDADLDRLQALADAATIPGAPGYLVRTDGTVWSVLSNWRGYGARQLRPVIHRGYYVVRMSLKDGSRIRKAVHRLVAMAFVPCHAEGRFEVRHLNGDPLDNRASNLAWGTQKENAADRERHGRTARANRNGAHTYPERRPTGLRNGTHTKPHTRSCGERARHAKLTVQLVRYAREQAASGRTCTAISKEIGVSLSAICRIVKRKAWAHVV